jgi:tetratricopeptide (TPR) repeat protein
VFIDRDAALKTAEKLLRQGKLEAAIAEYVRVTAAHPGDWSSVNALGDLYVRAGQIDRAVTQFARVGEYLIREGALARAAAVYKKVLRISPGDARGDRGLALVTGRQAAASSAAKPQDPAPDDPDARMHAARAAQDAADVPRACELLLEAAGLYEGQGRQSDALAAVAEASSIDPSNPRLRERMLRSLIAQGEIAQARYVARVVPELVLVAEAYERLGQQAEALDTIADAAAADPDDARLRDRVLRQFLAGGEVDRARRLARTPADLVIVAEELNRQARGGEVLDMLAEALDREPHNSGLREQLVTACLAAGDIARARSAARTSRDWILLARMLQQQGRASDAHEATQRDPHDQGLHAEFVRACIATGNLAMARDEARTKSEIVELADALEAQGDAAGALQMRADALRRDPDDPLLRVRLIRDYMRAGERPRAHALLTIDVAGDDAELVLLLARLEFGIGRLEEGRRALAHLLTVRGDRRDDVVALSRELVDAGQPEAAFACVDLFADEVGRRGEWSVAAAGLEAFVERVPHHVPALMRLVEVCVDGGLDARMTAAQGQLADACIASGQAAEARVIAEDLLLRAPWDRMSLERCRQALRLCDDPDPDRTIADLLSADNSMMLEDL